MSSAATARVTARLKEGDWYLHRTGKHQIWKHPNGATYPLSTTMSEGCRNVRNAFAQIARLERQGPRSPIPGHAFMGTATEVLDETQPPMTPMDETLYEPKTGGEWLRVQREEAGLSIQDVTELMQSAFPGFTPELVASVEVDSHPMSCMELDHMLTILDTVPPEDLPFRIVDAMGRTKSKSYWDACNTPTINLTLPIPAVEPEPTPICEEPAMPQLPNLSATRTDALALLTKACSSSMVSDEDVAAVLQEAREALKARAIANVAKDFE